MKGNAMKKIFYLLLIFMLLLLAGCGATPQDGQNSKNEKPALANAENKLVDQSNQISEEKNGKIKDINAIIKFVNETPTNKMTDQYGEKLKVFKNYETHYFDFTGEGHDDVAIVTWGDDKDNSYLPIIFVTTDISENEYTLINSDFRATKGTEFSVEDGFIIQNDQENKSYDIAYNINNQFIQMATRYAGYGDKTYPIQSGTDLKYEVKETFEKLDGFRKFNVNTVNTYLDEKGNPHKYQEITRSYTFNAKTHVFDIAEKQNMEPIPLQKLITENFIVGNDNTLKTFEAVYNESNLETAINYYYENRQKFSKNVRIKYLQDYADLVDGIIDIPKQSNINAIDEVITDNVIKSVSVDIKPIPEKMSSVFSVVKEFNVEDGSGFPKDIEQQGWYTITCINSDMTKKISLMAFDKKVLEDNDQNNPIATDGFVNTEFKTQQQMLEAIKYITYPTVLIQNLQQLKEFNHEDIWKTNIVIVPENIVFND